MHGADLICGVFFEQRLSVCVSLLDECVMPADLGITHVLFVQDECVVPVNLLSYSSSSQHVLFSRMSVSCLLICIIQAISFKCMNFQVILSLC